MRERIEHGWRHYVEQARRIDLATGRSSWHLSAVDRTMPARTRFVYDSLAGLRLTMSNLDARDLLKSSQVGRGQRHFRIRAAMSATAERVKLPPFFFQFAESREPRS